jgi:hypothetical protein
MFVTPLAGPVIVPAVVFMEDTLMSYPESG